MEESKIINPKAVVKVDIDFNIYTSLFYAIENIAKDKSEEELKNFVDAISNNKELSEEWMIHYLNGTILLQRFLKEVEANNHFINEEDFLKLQND